MSSIKYSLFDFFSYLLPGFILINWLYFYNNDLISKDMTALFEVIDKFNSAILLLVIPVAYISGLVLSFLGELLYNNLFKRFFKTKIDLQIRKSEAFILVREFSNDNFKYIETWIVYKKLCINISVTSIICLLNCIINGNSSLVAILSFVFLNVLFLFNAFKFDKWSLLELKNTIEKFELNKNVVEKFNEKNKR